MLDNTKYALTGYKSLFLALMSVLTLFCLVIPNSFPQVSAFLLLVAAIFSLPVIMKVSISRQLGFLLLGTWVVTLLYLVVGLVNGAPIEAVIQVLIVYIVSPLLWVFVFTALFYYVSDEVFISSLIFYSFLALISIVLFFYLFNNFGAGAVSFFREDANVNLNDGYAAATMHVYGSLIFLAGAFYSAPDLIKGNLKRLLLLGALFAAALTSGRSAFILAILLGLLVFVVSRNSFFKVSKVGLLSLIFIVFGCFIASLVLYFFYQIDLMLVLNLFFSEIAEAGGGERYRQSVELINGIGATGGLGAGHGLGVEYIRSYSFPWRYEAVWLATLYRVGFLGAFMYCLPFLLCFFVFYTYFVKGTLTSFDRFIFGGFLSVFLASTTNPYIEAFAFQWMYVMPVVYFLSRPRSFKASTLRV